MSRRFSSFLSRLLLVVLSVSIGMVAQQSDQGTTTPSNGAAAQTAPAPNPPQPSSGYPSDETQPSKVDVFAGYSFLSPNGAINGNKGITKGFTIAGSYWVNKYLGGVIETGSHFGDINTINTLTAGPTFRIPLEGITPFGLATFGINRESPNGFPSSTGFGFTGGGGFDLHFLKRLDIRLIEAEYEYGHHNFGFVGGSPTALRDNMGAAKISGGLVFKFGSVGPPPVPPSAACSAQPTDVLAGEPVQITVTPSNFNPKRTLTYTYTATGGKVNGTSQTTSVDTAGLNAGAYTVTANVSDGKKGMASCTATFNVKQNQPPTITCSANPTTVKPGDTAQISCQGQSPDNRPLTYKHEASAGNLTPSGANAALSTQGAQPGPITVTSTVTDDRNLSANTQSTVTVEAPPPPPPPPPQASKINQIDFPNKVKPWRVDNTAKAILDDVALRMQRDPDSKLVIVGSKDADEKRKNLDAERAVDAKFYLTNDKGVDPNRIETRSGGTAGKVAEFWIVPAGSTYQGSEAVVDESKIKSIPDHPAPKKGAGRRAPAKKATP